MTEVLYASVRRSVWRSVFAPRLRSRLLYGVALEGVWLWLGVLVRQFVRWCVALVESAGTFAATWWICARPGGLDEVVSLAIAGLAAVLAIAPLGWWATRMPKDLDTSGQIHGSTVAERDSGQAASVATTTNSPCGLAVGDNSGLVIGPGAVISSSTFHVTNGPSDAALTDRSSRSAPEQVVVGDIPHEPPAYQPRNDLLVALDAQAGAQRLSVVHAVTGMLGVGKT